MSHVITRFAPSPTGYLHAGNYRTALFSYIFARKNGGKFIVRIEDTDRARSKKEYEDNILESLKWLGLEYDEFLRQSERGDVYGTYIKKLIGSGHAFISKERPTREGDRTEVIRFKNPNKKVAFDDLVRGRVEFDTTELGDFVIAKSADEPVFHLVNVVDDHENGITHIIRGEDHISNTPRQILIHEALGFTLPVYAHIPLLLSKDRSKLSKRKGAVPISEYRNRGYLKEAMVNYLALLGWHPVDDREMVSLEDVTKEFTLERVQKSAAIFDEEKLNWFNRQYIAKLSDAEFIEHASPFLPEWLGTTSPLLKKLLPVVREKIATFGEITTLLGKDGELGFVASTPHYDAGLLLWKKNPIRESAHAYLSLVRKQLEQISSDSFSAASVKEAVWPIAESKGKGDVLWPLRVALSGREKSPDPFVIAEILGKDESQKRIDTALALLG